MRAKKTPLTEQEIREAVAVAGYGDPQQQEEKIRQALAGDADMLRHVRHWHRRIKKGYVRTGPPEPARGERDMAEAIIGQLPSHHVLELFRLTLGRLLPHDLVRLSEYVNVEVDRRVSIVVKRAAGALSH